MAKGRQVLLKDLDSCLKKVRWTSQLVNNLGTLPPLNARLVRGTMAMQRTSLALCFLVTITFP